MSGLRQPYTGNRDPWAPDQQGTYSGNVELAAAASGTQPGDAPIHVLCEYRGPPRPLQVEVSHDGDPLIVSPGDFTQFPRSGKLIWETAYSRWETDVRGGVYGVASAPYFRLSVQRYNPTGGDDGTPATRVRGAVLPGVIGIGAEYVATGAITLAAAASGDFPFVGAFRYCQAQVVEDIGIDAQVEVRSGERILYIDLLTPIRFPAWPRVDISGLVGSSGRPELSVRNSSASLTVGAILQVFG